MIMTAMCARAAIMVKAWPEVISCPGKGLAAQGSIRQWMRPNVLASAV
jgi:hypothetical protein